MTEDDVADDLRRGLRRAVRSDAGAFAYSILITVTYGAVSLQVGDATVGRLYLFTLGATLGFVVWEALASRGFRVRIREEPSDVVLVGTALAPVSVGLGLATALGALAVLPGAWAWAGAPFAATIVYVLIAGLQMTAARRHERAHPPDESE